MTADIKKSRLPIIFPFEYGNSEDSQMDIQWVVGDQDKGENLSLERIDNLPDAIQYVIYYKRGWIGELIDNYKKYPYPDEEPNILVAKLTNDVYVYIYTTADSSGYICINNFFEVRYAHELDKLYKYGITEKILKKYKIAS